MADYRAIGAVANAVVGLLRGSCCPPELGDGLEFRVFGSRDFADRPIANGVSLFIYRLVGDGTQRTLPGRAGPDGRRFKSRLPVNVHFLLTVWGGDASLQHVLAGWVMRLMEDAPVLSPPILNAGGEAVFGQDELVEVALADLTNEDLLRLWDTLGSGVVYQLSVPYVARVVQLESLEQVPAPDTPPVQTRGLDAGLLRT